MNLCSTEGGFSSVLTRSSHWGKVGSIVIWVNEDISTDLLPSRSDAPFRHWTPLNISTRTSSGKTDSSDGARVRKWDKETANCGLRIRIIRTISVEIMIDHHSTARVRGGSKSPSLQIGTFTWKFRFDPIDVNEGEVFSAPKSRSSLVSRRRMEKEQQLLQPVL